MKNTMTKNQLKLEQGMKSLKAALQVGSISVNEYSTLVYQLHQTNKQQ